MIYIASDYAGYNLKESLVGYFKKSGIRYVDLGSDSARQKNNFTDFIPPVVKMVRKNRSNRGILICGTGFGMEIGANRFRGIRATLVSSPEQARQAKVYDNSNILVLSAWNTSQIKAIKIFNVWFKARFKPLSRRVKRFKQIDLWPI